MPLCKLPHEINYSTSPISYLVNREAVRARWKSFGNVYCIGMLVYIYRDSISKLCVSLDDLTRMGREYE